MTSKKNSLENKNIRTRNISIMDKKLDDSLQEIIKLLVMNARINLLNTKENCKSRETECELEYLHDLLDSIMSRGVFQQQLK